MVNSLNIDILKLKIQKIDYINLIEKIKEAIKYKKQLTITYCNAHTSNSCYNSEEYKKLIEKFDIVHPDGFGVYFASKFLYGSEGFNNRITGSTFYQILLDEGINKGWRFFFFGDKELTLKKISPNNPQLKVAGYHNGFDYESTEILNKIANSKPDILIVGMGSPKQEKWIVDFRTKLKVNIIIAVGDGIKVFSGTKKRGPKFIQKIGLEWLVRLFYEPKRLWRRYLIGNPLFAIRIMKCKLLKNNF
jgi:N-acetylglucosaminyldiphosphoundecaprenol N-acetyl-beta-D-mannosaminyltransferase